MVSPRSRIKFTYQDYRNAPEDRRYELLDGELVVVPSPRTSHQRVLMELASRMHRFAQEFGLGSVFVSPFDVVLSDTDVVQPDILFVSNRRAGIITEDNVRGAPDLVIEILSPTIADRRSRPHVQARTLCAPPGTGVPAGGPRRPDSGGAYPR